MPGSLTIIGLGPGDPALRTIAAQRALDAADRIILRTAVHPGLDDLTREPRVTTCDDLYESGTSFAEVYQAIVNRVVDAVQRRDVVYAVPGHPRLGEATVEAIIERLTGVGVPISVIDGISALDAIATCLGHDLLRSEVQLLDALSLAAMAEADPYAGGLLDISPARPCLVMQVYSMDTASAVKLALGRVYPDDHQVAVVIGAGSGNGRADVISCPLCEIDHQAVDHLTSVWVPALAPLEAYRSFHTLQRIISRLRAPGGCPWDREQTHQSLREAILEEANEVIDAIAGGDGDALAEELGDLLFQPLMHAQIAEETGEFAFEDIVEHATRKLIRRHPHVFGDVRVDSVADVLTNWEAIKAAERREKDPRPSSERS